MITTSRGQQRKRSSKSNYFYHGRRGTHERRNRVFANIAASMQGQQGPLQGMPARKPEEHQRDDLPAIDIAGQLDRQQDHSDGTNRRCQQMREITVEDHTKKGCRQAANETASTRAKGRNILRRYINRLYRVCLLNTFAAVVLAFLYMETKSETIFGAMTVCEINAFITWLSY